MPASGATLTFILIGAKIYRILYTYQLKLAYLFQFSTKKCYITRTQAFCQLIPVVMGLLPFPLCPIIDTSPQSNLCDRSWLDQSFVIVFRVARTEVRRDRVRRETLLKLTDRLSQHYFMTWKTIMGGFYYNNVILLGYQQLCEIIIEC